VEGYGRGVGVRGGGRLGGRGGRGVGGRGGGRWGGRGGRGGRGGGKGRKRRLSKIEEKKKKRTMASEGGEYNSVLCTTLLVAGVVQPVAVLVRDAVA